MTMLKCFTLLQYLSAKMEESSMARSHHKRIYFFHSLWGQLPTTFNNASKVANLELLVSDWTRTIPL